MIGLDMQIEQYSALSAIPPSMMKGKKPAFKRANHAQMRMRTAIEDENGLAIYPKPVQDALDACTGKQRRFALMVASGLPHQRAYQQAYDVDPERELVALACEANAVYVNHKVSVAIELLSRWLDVKWLLDAGQAIDWALSNLYDLAENGKHESTRIKATELILRKHGELVNRQVITHIDVDAADSQEALFASILSDIEVMSAIEAPQVVSLHRLTMPSVVHCTCPKCGHHGEVMAFQAAGDGI